MFVVHTKGIGTKDSRLDLIEMLQGKKAERKIKRANGTMTASVTLKTKKLLRIKTITSRNTQTNPKMEAKIKITLNKIEIKKLSQKNAEKQVLRTIFSRIDLYHRKIKVYKLDLQ